jgi:predicted negative regulator of RcsB-dependent stress response
MLSKILIGIIIAGGIAGYFYYTTTQAELKQQAALLVAYEFKQKEQDNAINELQNNLLKQAENLNQLSAANAAAEAELNRYMDIFSRHDLTKLAAAKPGLIEPRINNGTNDVFKSLKESSTITPTNNN